MLDLLRGFQLISTQKSVQKTEKITKKTSNQTFNKFTSFLKISAFHKDEIMKKDTIYIPYYVFINEKNSIKEQSTQ